MNMIKDKVSVVIFIILIATTFQVKADYIRCGNEPCSDVAQEVRLTPTIERPVIYLHLAEHDIKIPIFADLSRIGSTITIGKNSFHNTYYYSDNQAISMSFYDTDDQFDLSEKQHNISMHKNGNIKAFFYEEKAPLKPELSPFFRAIIPIEYGGNNRFISLYTRGLSRGEITTLLSHLKEE